MTGSVTISEATPADIPAVLALVRELARFEQAEHEVLATEADFLRDGFGPEPRFRARIARLDSRVCGFTLWFFNYSTWLGRAGIHLEDLYVAEWARGRGVGLLLMRDLARLAVQHGAERLDLNVLHWNPARSFYVALGMAELEEWRPYRISHAALRALAAQTAGE